MKTVKSLKWLGFAVVALVLSACSDGEYKLGDAPPGLSPVPPSVITFSADKSEINAGESVTLNFEVANADYVEINGVSTDGTFEFQSGQVTELNSSVVVDSITATTEFILTATKTTVEESTEEGGDAVLTESKKSITLSKLSISKTEGDEETAEEETTDEETPTVEDPLANGLTDTASVLVTVIQNVELDVGIIAEPESIKTGEKAVLRWWAKPETDVTVAVSGSDGVAIVAKSLCGSVEDVESGEASEAVPAVGCAVVQPTATTTYTISATDKAGVEHPATATLTVEEEVVDTNLDIKSFTVSGEGDLFEADALPKEDVVISWEVMPEASIIKIVAREPGSDSELAGAVSGCELPNGSVSEAPADQEETAEGEATEEATATEDSTEQTQTTSATGSITCKIEKDVDLVLIASIADKQLERAVRVRAKAIQMAEVSVTGPAWAFEGEEIQVTIDPKTPADGAMVSGIDVTGADNVNTSSVQGGNSTTVDVTVPSSGAVTTTVTFSNGVQNAIPVTSIFSLRGDTLPGNVSSVNILNGNMYYGLNQGFNGGNATVVQRNKVTATTYTIPFAKLITAGLTGFNNSVFENKISRYAVGGVDLLEDGSMVVGMSGVVMRQNGTEWKRVRRLLFSSKGYPGSHPSCKGETQTGTTSGDVGGLVDICDIAVIGTTLVVATDHGAIWMENFPAEHNEPLGSKDTNLTYGAVVNDLEKIDGVVYAAVSAGIWNTDGGVFKFTGSNWEKVGSSIAEAYSLSYDGTNLIVGAKDGVYKLTLAGEATKLEGVAGPVYSVASSAGVVMAGTSTGVVVQRGEKWNPVMSDVLTADVKALALAESDGNMVVALSGASSIIDGVATLPNAPAAEQPEETETPSEEETQTPAE